MSHDWNYVALCGPLGAIISFVSCLIALVIWFTWKEGSRSFFTATQLAAGRHSIQSEVKETVIGSLTVGYVGGRYEVEHDAHDAWVRVRVEGDRSSLVESSPNHPELLCCLRKKYRCDFLQCATFEDGHARRIQIKDFAAC